MGLLNPVFHFDVWVYPPAQWQCHEIHFTSKKRKSSQIHVTPPGLKTFQQNNGKNIFENGRPHLIRCVGALFTTPNFLGFISRLSRYLNLTASTKLDGSELGFVLFRSPDLFFISASSLSDSHITKSNLRVTI